MTDSRLLDFIEACDAEIAARTGLRVVAPQLAMAHLLPSIREEPLDPVRYGRAIQALKKFAPSEKQALFDHEAHAITPGHFADLLGALIGPECKLDKEHMAGCTECGRKVAFLTAVFVGILCGREPEDVEKALGGALHDSKRGHEVDYINRAVCWVNFTLEPECLLTAARALEGLKPEQQKAFLRTAFTLVTGTRDWPDTECFKGIIDELGRIFKQRIG